MARSTRSIWRLRKDLGKYQKFIEGLSADRITACVSSTAAPRP